jgi:hypothetical protein
MVCIHKHQETSDQDYNKIESYLVSIQRSKECSLQLDVDENQYDPSKPPDKIRNRAKRLKPKLRKTT